MTIFFRKVETGLYGLLEGYGLQAKPSLFIEPEHEIHVLDGLADSAFQQVIDDAGDHYLVAIELVEMDKGLVCADNFA